MSLSLNKLIHPIQPVTHLYCEDCIIYYDSIVETLWPLGLRELTASYDFFLLISWLLGNSELIADSPQSIKYLISHIRWNTCQNLDTSLQCTLQLGKAMCKEKLSTINYQQSNLYGLPGKNKQCPDWFAMINQNIFLWMYYIIYNMIHYFKFNVSLFVLIRMSQQYQLYPSIQPVSRWDPYINKYSLLMHGLKFETFTKFIFEWKKSIYVWVYLFTIYILYLSTEEALSSPIV